MQIQGLHKNIYRLANYALSQEKYELRRKRYETPVCTWHKLGFPIKYVGGGSVEQPIIAMSVISER